MSQNKTPGALPCRWLVTALVPLLFGFLLLLIPQGEGDIWWRLGVGKTILKELKVPDSNRYSYTEPDHPWVDHAWGYDALVAATERGFGIRGVRLLHLMALFAVGLFTLRPRSLADLLWALPGGLLLLAHHALRPYVLSDLLVVALFALLLKERARPRAGILLVLFLLWGNLHGSALMALGALALITLPDKLEGESLLRWGALVGALGLTLLVNPYGYKAPLLSASYMTGQQQFLPELLEWGPPGAALFVLMGFFAVAAAWGILPERKILFGGLFTSGLLILSMISRRHIPLFVLATIWTVRFPLLPPPPLGVKKGAAVLALFTLVAIPVVLCTPSSSPQKFYPSKLFTALERALPREETHAVFAPHAWGGALIYHFQGRTRHYLDARNDCYSMATFSCYKKIRRLAPDWWRCLGTPKPRHVLLPPGILSLARSKKTATLFVLWSQEKGSSSSGSDCTEQKLDLDQKRRQIKVRRIALNQ